MKKEEVIKNLNPLFLKGIAHRGYHNEQYTENGLLAFKNALVNNLAIELDVHLTKDNELLVCHDSELKRTTGKSGIIEDLTLKEIKENYKLLDKENIPTFQEVLTLIKEQVPIVVELKVYKKNYKPLAKKLKEELMNIKNKSNFFLISFDPRALLPFKHSGFMRSLLVTKDNEWAYMFRNHFESVDLDQRMISEKRVRKYHKKHFINVWTIESEEEFDKVYPYVDTVTFQLFDFHYVVDKLSKK
ncbi:MAG: glycerophosphodiester phosphodiesterase family protein [Bacilli bacterium]